MEHLSLIQMIVVWAIPVLFAITVHEVAHGWVASRLGDKTALMMGRITLNPFKHIDLFGTVLVPILCLTLGGFIFGWAKPVPVNWQNLRKPRRDAALVAAAGPGVNLLMALIWAGITKAGEFLHQKGFENSEFLVYMGIAGISINLMLMIVNLVPIPPLDGSRVVSSLLPKRAAYHYDKLEPYGFIILLLLIFTNVLSYVLLPAIEFLQRMVITVFSI